MAYRVRPCRSLDELAKALGAIGHYFGWVPSAEEVERFSKLLPVERMHAAFGGREIVGGAGVFPFQMTVPGAVVQCAGVTVVGVLPTHRRRGILRRLMRAQLDDVRERGEPLAALWASEPTIYGRFGYGQASYTHEIRLPRPRAALRGGLPPRTGQVRLVETAEAEKTFPRIYDRIRVTTPGMLTRTKEWWDIRRLTDDVSRRPPGSGPLNLVLFELDRKASGFAIYRIAQREEDGHWKRRLHVVEALGVDAVATRELWRFLTELDWTDEILAWLLPTDHPVQHLFGRFDQLDLRVGTGLWVDLVDVGAALSARGYRTDGRVTFELSHPFCPWNEGTWTVSGGRARKTSRRPDLRLDATALGAAYLGGVSFGSLSRAGLVEEAVRGGLARADALFAGDRAPWCPEIF
jgi:predicted acetyltransferase